ncbi:hypothetical protein N7507_001798 [Penicillium longicatenatum]|nr:hypothetical protein N7507_001798 [Penicillium longicatenatum]
MDFVRVSPQNRPWLVQFRSSESFTVFVVTIAILTDSLMYNLIVPVMPKALVVDIGVKEQHVQKWVSLMQGAYGGALLSAALPLGFFADRYHSRKLPFILGLLGLALSTGLFMIAKSPIVLVVARGLQGLSAATPFVVGLALIANTVGPNRLGEAMGHATAGMTLGSLIGPIIGGLSYDNFGYKGTFYIPIGLICLDMLLRLAILEHSDATHSSPEPTSSSLDPESQAYNTFPASSSHANPEENTRAPLLAQSLPQKSLNDVSNLSPLLFLLGLPRLQCGIFGCIVICSILSALEATLPLYVMEIFHWTATRSGLIFLPMTLPSLGGSLVGKIIDKFGARIPTAIAFLTSAVALGCLRFVTVDNSSNHWLLVGLLIVFGFTCLGVQIGLMTEIFRVISETEESHPQVFGVSSAISQGYGLYTMASAAGLLIGPLLGGSLKNAIGWGGLTLSLASVCTLAAVLILCLNGQTSHRE